MSTSSPTPPPDEPAPGGLLLVDDEPNILRALTRTLRPLGRRLFTASSAMQALQILEREAVDLIISDMRMPEMDGAELLARVAQRWPQTVRILLTGYADLRATVAAINRGGIYRYVAKPWDDADLRLLVMQGLDHQALAREKARLETLTRAQNEELKKLNAELEDKVKARTAELEQLMQMLELSHDTLKKSYAATVQVFANLMETRNGMSSGHARRVAETAEALARRLGLLEAEVRDLFFAGLLHDLGKAALSDALLVRPFHLLTIEQRAEVMQHPVLGQTLLMALEPLAGAGWLVRAHHERYDGKGYPDRLAGEAIPLGARILAVAEDYDELQLGLLVAERLTPAQAARFIRDGAGARYDPEVVKAFLDWYEREAAARPPRGERFCRLDALRPGMVLTRALTARGGLLLLPSGTTITETHLERLRAIERALGWRLEVYVRDGHA